MLETIVAYLMAATPYILLAVGVLGVFLLFARMTVKFVAPAIRS